MIHNLQLKTATEEHYPLIEQLYEISFPDNERRPFSIMIRLLAEHKCEIMYFEKDGAFCGLAIMLFSGDLVLLDYFAICPELRGQGVGASALALLQEYYASRRFFLETELPNDVCDNYDQRVSRLGFYRRNQMTEIGLHAHVYETDFTLMGHACTLSFAEYYQLYENCFGPVIAKKVEQLP